MRHNGPAHDSFSRLLPVVWLLLASGTFSPAAPRAEALLPPLPAAPVVDGVLTPAEWDGAFQCVGFQGIQPPHLMDPRTGRAWFGYTADRLYVALATPLPPDGALVTQDGSALHLEDTVEVWLDPNRDVREHAQGDRRLYQFIANAKGATFIQRIQPGPHTSSAPQTNDTWTGNWQFAQTADPAAKLWIFEASLPWTDFEWPAGEPFDRSIGVLIVRNYQRPAGQRTWFQQRETFLNALDYPRLTLRRAAPFARIESLGDALFQGRLQLKVRIVNPGPAVKAAAWARVTSPRKPPVHERKDLDLPEKGEAVYDLELKPEQLGEGPREVKLLLRRQDPEETLLNWSMTWTPTNGGWNVNAVP